MNVTNKAEKDSIRYAELPLISVLGRQQMDQAKELLEELNGIKAQKKVVDERELEINEELGKIQADAKLPGLRWGPWAFAEVTMPGRETLDKGKLVEAGVSVDVIRACMVRGKEYSQRNFKRLGEELGGGGRR